MTTARKIFAACTKLHRYPDFGDKITDMASDHMYTEDAVGLGRRNLTLPSILLMARASVGSKGKLFLWDIRLFEFFFGLPYRCDFVGIDHTGNSIVEICP